MKRLFRTKIALNIRVDFRAQTSMDVLGLIQISPLDRKRALDFSKVQVRFDCTAKRVV